jgi:hypothetical protein
MRLGALIFDGPLQTSYAFRDKLWEMTDKMAQIIQTPLSGAGGYVAPGTTT